MCNNALRLGHSLITVFLKLGLPVRLYKTSSTWMDARAPFVQMMMDGNDRGDPRRESDRNGRWTAHWM